MKQQNWDKEAQEILRMAKDSGVQSNFLFRTTFDRYLTQLKILAGLKQKMAEDDLLVTKEYVKGRKNIYTNPAVGEYNRTSDSANRTVTTLKQIIKDFSMSDQAAEEDPLLKILNGGDADDE